MRISSQGPSLDYIANNSSNAVSAPASVPSEDVAVEVADTNTNSINDATAQKNEEQQITKEQVKKAVDSLNKFMSSNHPTAAKFVFHEGLNQYFVQVVDAQTEKVVKEIPPKKLLDAFYEMQKMVGMIVDEKV